MVEIGDSITYVDEYAIPHRGLVTNVFGTTPVSAINLIYVSHDTNEIDQYGRQIKRETSVVPKTQQTAHGRYWYE